MNVTVSPTDKPAGEELNVTTWSAPRSTTATSRSFAHVPAVRATYKLPLPVPAFQSSSF